MNIRELIQKLSLTDENYYSEFAVVQSINEISRTANVKTIVDDVEFDVNLQPLTDMDSGLVIVPENDSVVVISYISKETAFISLTSKIKKIILSCDDVSINDGTFGGLVKVEILNAALNSLQTQLNQIKAATSAGFTSLSALDSGASLSAFSSASQTVPIDISQIENKKFKHG